MRWSIGFFGVKDLFTMVNLLGGVLGIYFAFLGHPAWAGYAILAGYFFGDALDGPVARATGTGNRFGGEFDSAADHIGQGIAPAVVVFSAYHLIGQTTVGFVLMAALVSSASIRQARFNVDRFDSPLTYCGLPRTVSGFVALAYPNSLLFKQIAIGAPLGIGVIGAMALLNLAPIPYMTHRGDRRMQGWVKVLVVSFLVTPIAVFVFARPYTFDVMLVYALGYVTLGWLPLRPEERKAFYAEYRRWSRQVATLK
jgi:phosphatidylserine synthase